MFYSLGFPGQPLCCTDEVTIHVNVTIKCHFCESHYFTHIGILIFTSVITNVSATLLFFPSPVTIIVVIDAIPVSLYLRLLQFPPPLHIRLVSTLLFSN